MTFTSYTTGEVNWIGKNFLKYLPYLKGDDDVFHMYYFVKKVVMVSVNTDRDWITKVERE